MKWRVVGSITSPQHFHWHVWKVIFMGASQKGSAPASPLLILQWLCQPCCWVGKAYLFFPRSLCGVRQENCLFMSSCLTFTFMLDLKFQKYFLQIYPHSSCIFWAQVFLACVFLWARIIRIFNEHRAISQKSKDIEYRADNSAIWRGGFCYCIEGFWQGIPHSSWLWHFWWNWPFLFSKSDTITRFFFIGEKTKHGSQKSW